MAEFPPPPPIPLDSRTDRARRRRWRRILIAVAAVVVLLAGFIYAAFIGPVVTNEGVIPPSCHQPSTIDYSTVGPRDRGPYSVKLRSWSSLPWVTTATALVGHGQSADSLTGYGFGVDIESTDIHTFRCEWTSDGVTITEPGESGLQHFVPASEFLGGR